MDPYPHPTIHYANSSLAVVLVRRAIDARNAGWAALPDAGKARVRQALWRAFTSPGAGPVLRPLAHAVAKASEGWTDLLPALIQLLGAAGPHTAAASDASAAAAVAGRRAAVFFLLEQMAEFSPELKQGASNVAGVFATALAPTMAPTVQVAAVKAWLALLTNLQTDHLLLLAQSKGGAAAASVQLSPGAEAMSPLAPLALQAVAALLVAGEGEVGGFWGAVGGFRVGCFFFGMGFLRLGWEGRVT